MHSKARGIPWAIYAVHQITFMSPPFHKCVMTKTHFRIAFESQICIPQLVCDYQQSFHIAWDYYIMKE
jgi:hypothetical protein